jgi:hypothetical protein
MQDPCPLLVCQCSPPTQASRKHQATYSKTSWDFNHKNSISRQVPPGLPPKQRLSTSTGDELWAGKQWQEISKCLYIGLAKQWKSLSTSWTCCHNSEGLHLYHVPLLPEHPSWTSCETYLLIERLNHEWLSNECYWMKRSMEESE